MNVCRICLSTNIYRDVFELENEIKDGKSSSDIMLFCLDLKVTQESTVSTRLCSQCFGTVIAFYKFKVSAHKNDEHFQMWESNVSTDAKVQVKVEAVENPEGENVFFEVTVAKIEDGGQWKVGSSSENDASLQSFIKQEPDTEIPIDIEEGLLHSPPIELKRESPKTVKPCSTVKSEHYKIQSKDKIKLCNLCHKSCSNITELKHHIFQVHRLEKRYHCAHCDKKFSQKYRLECHMRLHIENGGQRKTYPCQACDKVYFTSFACKKHYRVRHLNIKDKCSICDKEVVGLANHMVLVHNPEQLRFRCNQCPRAFYSKSNLRWHERLHVNERPFSCHLCDAKFGTACTLKNHVMCVHEKQKPFMCQICSKNFSTKTHLKGHLRSHEGLKPFKCEECGKCVSTARSLRMHQIAHTGEKPFACTLCDKRLANPSSLRHHMITHTKERKFPCSYCDSRFTRSDHRNNHQRTAHGHLLGLPTDQP